MPRGPWRNRPDDDHPIDATFSRIRDEMERLYDRFTGDQWGTSPLESWPARFGWGPRMDLIESSSDITISAELPGVDPNEVDIQISEHTLTISGEKKRDDEMGCDDKMGCDGEPAGSGGLDCMQQHYGERQFGPFQRTVQLPATVDADKVEAKYAKGVLKITLQKTPDVQPRRIEVKVE